MACSSVSTQLSHPALRALQHVAQYDEMRLRTYRDNENHGDKIGIASIGPATALRFDDVGYFNRVYAGVHDVWDSIDEIESFYRGGPWGCELIGPTDETSGPPVPPRWSPGNRHAWLHGRVSALTLSPGSSEFTIRPPVESERVLFLRTYLRGFEASPTGFTAAVRNMRHLFKQPGLDFMMAWRKDRPAGIGVMYRAGDSALLCGGATLPGMRRRGCHHALVAARLRLARDYGCREVFSWASAEGQSQANMEHAGLRTIGITQGWRLATDQNS
jgi:hypothetical protein